MCTYEKSYDFKKFQVVTETLLAKKFDWIFHIKHKTEWAKDWKEWMNERNE